MVRLIANSEHLLFYGESPKEGPFLLFVRLEPETNLLEGTEKCPVLFRSADGDMATSIDPVFIVRK